MKDCKKHVVLILVLVALMNVFLGCSNNASQNLISSPLWQSNGSIVLTKAVPPISDIPDSTMLAFLPSPVTNAGLWLSINTRDETVSLISGSEVLAKVQGSGISKMTHGEYQILHKQRNPLWYAPDGYFSKRELDVPASGSQSRFLRGALGDFALFLTKDTPIHNGPVWSDDIGGIQLDEADISRLYYQLEIGARVEVR